MRKDGEKYPSNVVKRSSFPAYLSNSRYDVFACLKEHTEREEVEKGARAEEDRNKAEAASGQKQADEEQQQKVTLQTSAVLLSHFCPYISRLFLSHRPRWDFVFCLFPGVHRTRGGGEASSKYSGRLVLGSRYAPTEASG